MIVCKDEKRKDIQTGHGTLSLSVFNKGGFQMDQKELEEILFAAAQQRARIHEVKFGEGAGVSIRGFANRGAVLTSSNSRKPTEVIRSLPTRNPHSRSWSTKWSVPPMKFRVIALRIPL